MTANTVPAPKWLAYRMQGFSGFHVPEFVAWYDDAFIPGWYAKSFDTYLSRTFGDGACYDSYEECKQACDRGNAGRSL